MAEKMSDKEMQDFLDENKDMVEPKENFFSKATKTAKEVVEKVKTKADEYQTKAKEKRQMNLESRIAKAQEEKEFKKLEAQARQVERENRRYDDDARADKKEKIKRFLAPLQGAVGGLKKMGGGKGGRFEDSSNAKNLIFGGESNSLSKFEGGSNARNLVFGGSSGGAQFEVGSNARNLLGLSSPKLARATRKQVKKNKKIKRKPPAPRQNQNYLGGMVFQNHKPKIRL